MMTQLHTPVPLRTPKGKAWAVALIDYGPQWELLWVTFVRETGECWTFRNSQIRQEANYTFGLPSPSPIANDGAEKTQPLHTMPGNGITLNGTPPLNS